MMFSLLLFCNILTWRIAEAYLEPRQTSGMELFVKLVSSFQSSTIFAKSSVLDIWLSFECASREYLKYFLDFKSYF